MGRAVTDMLAPWFECPYWLFLLLLCLVLWFLCAWSTSRAVKRIEAAGDTNLILAAAGSSSRTRKILKEILFLLGIALAALSLARPGFQRQGGVVKGAGMDVVLCIDMSRSMLARDIRPDRFTRAVSMAVELVHRLEGDRIGLVGFAGLGLPQCPPTTSTRIIKERLLSLHAASLGPAVAGTNIEDGLEQSMDMLKRAPGSGDKVIVLFSDGEGHEGDPLAAAAVLKQAGIRIVTVETGTTGGAPVPLYTNRPGGSYMKDIFGNIVISRLQDDFMNALAEDTGGISVKIDDMLGLERVTTFFSGLKRDDYQKRLKANRLELFQVPLFLSLLLFLVSFTIPERRRRAAGGLLRHGHVTTIAVLSLLLFSTTGFDLFKGHDTDIDRAIDAVKMNDSARALALLKKAVKRHKESPVPYFDMGVLLFGRGRFDRARQAFTRAYSTAKAAGDKSLISRSQYNLGNTALKTGDPGEAVQHFRLALLYDKDDRDAKINLELALKRLDEKKKKQASSSANHGQSKEKKHENKRRNTENKQENNKGGRKDAAGERKRVKPRDQQNMKKEAPVPGRKTNARAAHKMDKRMIMQIIRSIEGRKNALGALRLLPMKFRPRRTDKPW
ncbi:MAG: VWA domain-containing protein [Deltaproteobacteria bacterium]|nr:VWA domain-containing protein [Deltaproteobacteria bacterium]